MSGHVDLDIADYVAGRLPDERRREVEDHLRNCDNCAAEANWVNEFRSQALRQGLRHVDPARIVELSARGESANQAEQEHLASCERCRAEVAWSGERPTPDEKTEDEETEPPAVSVVRRTARLRPFHLAWLAAAAMIVAVVWLVPRGDRLDPSQFAIVEPLSVRISRSSPEAGSFEESRLRGLEAYASGNYTSAREHFLRALSMESDRPELLLYLGSAELLDNDLDSAEAHLRQATVRAPAGAVRDEASWQLANALLLLGRLDEATHTLSILANQEGRRQDDAVALLEAIDEMK